MNDASFDCKLCRLLATVLANPSLATIACSACCWEALKTDPGEPMDKDIYDLTPEEMKAVPSMPSSLEEALGALEDDHAFLLKGDVFTKDFLESYIDLKMEEVHKFEHTPHPIEFEMYYSV